MGIRITPLSFYDVFVNHGTSLVCIWFHESHDIKLNRFQQLRTSPIDVHHVFMTNMQTHIIPPGVRRSNY